MAGTFALIAIPRLRSESEGKGYLESVTFIATGGGYTRQWSIPNTGTYTKDLLKIVPLGNAQSIIDSLRRDETVLFPGIV